MFKHTIRHSAALTTAVILLALTVTNASAGRLQASEQSIRASWSSLEFILSGRTLRCRVTLEGSFHSRTIPKVSRALIGAITRAIVAHPCTGGEMWEDNGTEAEPLGTAPNRLPFHLTYENFTGALPNISAIGLLLSRVSFVIQTPSGIGFDIRCRFGNGTDNISGSASRTFAGGAITSITPVAGRDRSTLVEGLLNSGFCPASISFGGTSGAVTGVTNTNTISITLI